MLLCVSIVDSYIFSSVQLNIHYVADSCAVETMYVAIMDTLQQFINVLHDYQGVLVIQFSLHAKAPFMTITKCACRLCTEVSLIPSVHINMFHCISVELQGRI